MFDRQLDLEPTSEFSRSATSGPGAAPGLARVRIVNSCVNPPLKTTRTLYSCLVVEEQIKLKTYNKQPWKAISGKSRGREPYGKTQVVFDGTCRAVVVVKRLPLKIQRSESLAVLFVNSANLNLT